MELEEAGNLIGVDITAPLRHEADTSLRLAALVGVDVVDEGRLVGDLKVANVAVALQEWT